VDFVVGLIIIAAIVIAAIYLTKWSNEKRKAETWTGTVENKKVSDVYDSDGAKTGVSYDLTIRMSDGKKKKVTVARSAFDSVNVGDVVEKKAGEMDPVQATA
jgi:uncharacterized protein YxeA